MTLLGLLIITISAAIAIHEINQLKRDNARMTKLLEIHNRS